ncbi:hypothetical protein AMTR_s00024p00034210 [Amborella trichopoda]|uniref:Uncharacterized protein n=1 Tax=Amborella trichopoda TaxID=13333 RepID=W1PTH7_AMBTC|nr:hypothetical protein AMTR_s00024p00034210 [Amborella trichopoda]
MLAPCYDFARVHSLERGSSPMRGYVFRFTKGQLLCYYSYWPAFALTCHMLVWYASWPSDTMEREQSLISHTSALEFAKHFVTQTSYRLRGASY